MRERFVLIGAGSAIFTRGLVADLIHRRDDLDLCLVDIDPDALSVAEGLARKMIAARNAPIRLSAHLDRREALPGATVVIGTIGVGGRRAWEQDVFIPRRFGIYQPVGDSVMPGGTSRALRMIPAMIAIARDVLDLAPQALFFNYGNPMSPVCRAVRKATGAPLIGLCHGVFHVAKRLAAILNVPADRLIYTAVGINHLSWFVELREKGRDLIPRLREIARERLAAIDLIQADAALAKPFEAIGDPFSWQLTELFGAFPAVMDRHVTEFFPHLFAQRGAYYGKTLGVDAYPFEDTIAYGDAIFRSMREQAFSPDPLPGDFFDRIAGEHEQVVDIVACMRTDAGKVFSANMPNTGQVPNLPADAIVECPCLMTAAGPRPLQQPPLAPGLAATLASRFLWVETLVEAAIEGSREKFVQALLVDGSVDSVETARKLADALIEGQAAYLPQFQSQTKV